MVEQRYEGVVLDAHKNRVATATCQKNRVGEWRVMFVIHEPMGLSVGEAEEAKKRLNSAILFARNQVSNERRRAEGAV